MQTKTHRTLRLFRFFHRAQQCTEELTYYLYILKYMCIKLYKSFNLFSCFWEKSIKPLFKNPIVTGRSIFSELTLDNENIKICKRCNLQQHA